MATDSGTESQPSAQASVPRKEPSSGGVLLWTGLLCIIGFFGYYYFLSQADSKLTLEIRSRIQSLLPDYHVELDNASLQSGQSITLNGLRLSKRVENQDREVFRAERIACQGPLDWLGLVQGQVPVQNVVADGVQISVWPLADGTWCFPEPKGTFRITPEFPTIRVRSGLIRLGHEVGSESPELIFHDLTAVASLLPSEMASAAGNSACLGIQARIKSSHFQDLNLSARLDPSNGNWRVRGDLTNLEFNPRVAANIPSCLQSHLTSVDGLSIRSSTRFEIASIDQDLTYQIYTKADGGRWFHPRLNYPLDNLSGELFLNNQELRLRNLRGECGSSVLWASIDMNGLEIPSPMMAVVEVKDLELDQRLFQSLPEPMQDIWHRFQARGHLDAKATITFDGYQWHPYVEVETKNLSLNAEFFPYPLHRIGGKFSYNDGHFQANNFVAYAGEQRLTGSLELVRADPKWLMDLQFSSEGPIAIDKSLLNALTPRNESQPSSFQSFVDSLRPTGTVHLKQARFRRTAEDPTRIDRSLELIFSECTLRYDQFRYPIDNVHGEITVDNDRVVLRDFAGRNDSTRIKAFGVCQLEDSQLDSLDLVFDSYDLAMDEELRNALPKGVQSLWDEIQPVGMMGHAKVEMTKRSRDDSLDVRVEMKKDSIKDEGVGRSLAFRPRSLPYSINDVSCHIAYNPGRIDILSLTGTHDASRLNAEGHYRIYGDGSWDGTIQWIPSTRFLVDQTLLSCLPPYLRDPLLRLDFRGPVSISGSTYVSSPRHPLESVVRSWDIDLEIEDGRLGGGGIASGMRGTISMTGENTDSGPMAYGTLEFDALAIKGIPVIGLTGPFALTSEDLIFGRDAVAWQEKHVMQKRAALESTNQNGVKWAFAQSTTADQGQQISQASFKSVMHSRLDARFVKLSQSALGHKSVVKKGQAIDGPELDITAHDITAEALSGKLFVSGVEPLDGRRARYRVRLVDANLKDCLLDLGEPNPQTNGSLWMQCEVAGSFTNMASIEGNGNVWLRNANLYQLPVMIRLFNLLSVRPDHSAFDAVDIHFGIDGDRIPIHELNLDGNLVSLRGNGWVNMRRALHLNLDANVSRRTLVGAVMRPLQADYSSNLFRIEVSGTTTDPIVRSNVGLMGQMQLPSALDKGGGAGR
ncbi:hypothetical protein SH449x_002467 [Pirellulaceae bacterium SH449]